MDTEQRVSNYGRGAFALTPAQRRRAAKKDRRAKRRPVAYVKIPARLGHYACLEAGGVTC